MAARSTAGPIVLGPPRHQKILATLLLNGGNLVQISKLISVLWPEWPPGTARQQVHNGVAALRRTFVSAGAGKDVISTSFAGVRLNRSSFDVDLYRASDLIASAHRSTDRHFAARHLRSAVNLWAGPSLAGLTGPYFESAAVALEEQRLAALELCLDHELDINAAANLVAELTALAAQHPLREGFTRQLMLALYRSCRQAEALAVYQILRSRLQNELGIAPNREVSQLAIAILRADPRLDAQIPLRTANYS